MRLPPLRGWIAALSPGVAVLPHCPACLMALLALLGVGHSLHQRVFLAAQLASLAATGLLLVALWRVAPRRVFMLGVAGAAAVLLGFVGLSPAPVAWAGAGALAAAWLVSLRSPGAVTCACAPHPEAVER